jgi:chemotaxis protein MotB
VKVPGDSKTGLYANLRCSKNEVNVGENLLLDSSASMELDPEARITNREISLDGGQSFTPMKSEYEIVSFDKPGLKTIQLKVTDSKGTQQLDNDRVTVVASEAPKVATLNPDEISKIDTSKGSEYAIPNGILFQTGEADISEQGKQLLASFAKVIANKNVVVAVDGYTDNVPIVRMGKYADNLQLSEARANSAVDVLVANGVKREHLRASGKGDSMPAVPNTSSEGRAINRRIKISIIPINSNN